MSGRRSRHGAGAQLVEHSLATCLGRTSACAERLVAARTRPAGAGRSCQSPLA